MDKEKKKTLTISSDLKKKIDTTSISTSGKKSFSVEKKKPFKSNKSFNKQSLSPGANINQDIKKKNFARKFIEQQATKDFIKKDNKPAGKSKLRLKGPVDKRDFKLTVSRALNVEEIEIKQRSLASVKRARLKEKKNQDSKNKTIETKKVVHEVNIPNKITIQELSNRMAMQANGIIKHLLGMGVVATINHTIDADTAEYLVKEFGNIPVREKKPDLNILKTAAKDSKNLKTRSPIVTVMGHVDHGKTSLLDALRKTNVVAGEHGGITQHIGAYTIETEKGKKITFIDTPGHAAFTEMRARGSKVTDIIVLVVAADDGVKPQTIEAIQHAKAAKVPIIVAINKIDLPSADPQKIKNDLLQYELIAEELSGDTLFTEVSATTKKNLDKLKENIMLQSDLLDLKTNFDGFASGVILESRIDKGKGPVSTVLVTSGSLKKEDFN